jgi:hypothetical protein
MIKHHRETLCITLSIRFSFEYLIRQKNMVPNPTIYEKGEDPRINLLTPQELT